MAEEGDREDSLGVNLRWPNNYAEPDEEESVGVAASPQDLQPPIADPPASRRTRKAAAADPPPSRRTRKPATPSSADVDMAKRVPATLSETSPDQTLSERVSRMDKALSSITEQISALTERTVALHELVSDTLDAAANGPAMMSAPSELDPAAHPPTADINKALAASDKAVRRVEQLTTALSVEVAEIGQAISDEVTQYSSATADEVRDVSKSMNKSLTAVTRQLEGLATALADNYDRPSQSPLEGFEDLVEGTAEAVTRIETLVEALIEASDARPTDISEYSARTLERLGLTVGARFEANTTTAVESIETAVNQAVDRAVAEFKEVAPPLVDRSTTAAITRLEERVAALTRQRDEHDRETKVTLNGLEETVGRLAAAQAEDLERILDTIEGASLPTPVPEKTDEDRLARIERSIAALTEASKSPHDFDDAVVHQFATVNKHLEALRRRLPVRGRATTGGLDERSLDELAALIAERLRATPTPSNQPRAPRPIARAGKPTDTARSASRSTALAESSPRTRRRPIDPKSGSTDTSL